MTPVTVNPSASVYFPQIMRYIKNTTYSEVLVANEDLTFKINNYGATINGIWESHSFYLT